MRITSPQIQHPCFYGVDMATKGELIGAYMDIEQVRQHIGADSLGHLSLAGTAAATAQPEDALCTACFSGQYPREVPIEFDKLMLETRPADRDPAPLPFVR